MKLIEKRGTAISAFASTLESYKSPLPDVLVVRVGPACWCSLAALTVMAAVAVVGNSQIPPSARRPSNPVVDMVCLAGLVLFWVGFTVWFALYFARRRTIATREGLFCREIFEETYVPWEQVRSYYTRRVKNATLFFIKTREGKEIRLVKGSNQDLLLHEIVVQRALWADGNSWKPEGSFLPENETRVFRIRRDTGRKVHGILGLALLILLGCLWVAWCQRGMNLWSGFTTAPPPSWAWLVNPIWMMGGVFVLHLLPAFAVEWPAHRYDLRHWQDQVSVSRERIRWSDGSRSVDVKWDEIVRYRAQQSRVLADVRPQTAFETAQGMFVINFPAFEDGVALRHAIKNYLPPEAQQEQQTAALGKQKTTRDGGLIFDYRNGTTRALLYLPAFVFSARPAISCLWRVCPLLAPPGPPVSNSQLIWQALFGAVPLAICGLGYFRSRVVVRGEFLEHRSFFWTRRVPLKDIEAMKLVSFFLVISTAEKNLVLGCTLSSPDALKKLIREHTGTDLLE